MPSLFDSHEGVKFLRKQLIYDFGMHVADDTAVYLKKGFRVVGIEADPLLCSRAQQRFAAEISAGDLIVVNRAIGSRAGAFNFYICNEQTTLSTASASFAKGQARGKGVTFRTVKVEFTTADKILAEYGKARYAKIDIEGHDFMCLEQMLSGGIYPDFLSFEVDLSVYSDALAACVGMGFTRFALVDQSGVDGLVAPAVSAEGQTIEDRFGIGQSGPFGDDLQASWQSAEEIASRCFKLRYQSKLTGLISKLGGKGIAGRLMPGTQTWYDIHAGR